MGVTDLFRLAEGGGVGRPLLDALPERVAGDVGETNLPLCAEPDGGGDIVDVDGRSYRSVCPLLSPPKIDDDLREFWKRRGGGGGRGRGASSRYDEPDISR